MTRSARAFLLIDGAEPPDAVATAIDGVSFDEAVVGRPAPSAEIALTVRNHGYRLTDADAFAVGRTLDVLVSPRGSADAAEHLARGIIVKTVPTFGTRAPTLRVVARSPFDTALAGRRLKNWTGRSDAAIATEIARLRGWATTYRGRPSVVAPGATGERAQSEADGTFLAALAKRYGYDVGLRWDQTTRRWALHFGRPLEEDTGRELVHFDPTATGESSLLMFAPIITSAGQSSTAMEVRGFSPVTRTEETGEVRRILQRSPTGARETTEIPVTRQVNVGARLRLSVFGEAIEVDIEQPTRSREEAAERAEAWFRTKQDLFLAGKGSMLGDPTVRAGQVFRFRFLRSGPSATAPLEELERWGGRYLLTRVRHNLPTGGRYECTFGARRIVEELRA